MALVDYSDLREFLSRVEHLGELKKSSRRPLGQGDGRDYGDPLQGEGPRNRRPSCLTGSQAYPEGYRCLYGMLSSPKRFAFSLGLPLPDEGGLMSLLKAYREKMKGMKLLPPRYVEEGPVLENVMEGSDIDLLRFPTPVHHELDGGRYIGTADGVITRDPEEGWVNCGTYRVQLVDRNTCLLYISQGKQGRIQRDKYLDKGQPCPAVVVIGIDPLLYIAARYQVPWGTSEFDFAGGLMGEPMEVIKGKYTGLPIPARAEIVLEGEVLPRERLPEGPFGEWHGYYAGGKKEEPVFKVKRVMFRSESHPDLRGFSETPSLPSLREVFHPVRRTVGRSGEGRMSGRQRGLGPCSGLGQDLQRGLDQTDDISATPGRPGCWPPRFLRARISAGSSWWWTMISIPPISMK